MRPHGVSAFALVLVTSFAIDRLVSGILFLGMWSGILTDPEKMAEGEERYKARRTYKAIYYAIAGALGIVVMASLGGIMLLTALLPADSSVTAAPIFRLLDIIVTGLALMGGVEKLPELLKIGKETGGAFASASTSESPIKVEGKLFRTNRDSASHDARILVRSTDRQRLGQNRESSRSGVLAAHRTDPLGRIYPSPVGQASKPTAKFERLLPLPPIARAARPESRH